MLSNINVDKSQFLQLMLVGQPQLKKILSRPQLLQFAQRVSSDFHLKALVPDEVVQYIGFRISAVGSRDHLFSQEACAMIAASQFRHSQDDQRLMRYGIGVWLRHPRRIYHKQIGA